MAKHIILTDTALTASDIILATRGSLPQVIGGLEAGEYTVRNTSAPLSGTVTASSETWTLSDDFAVKATGALTGAADTGQAYSTLPATATILNESGLWPSGGSMNLYSAFEAQNVIIECTRFRNGPTPNGAPWMLGRVDAAGTTFYQFGSDQGGTELRIGKTVAGTYTVIATVAQTKPANNVVQTWRAEIIGSTLTFYVDGVQVLTATDTTITAAGRVGLRNSNGDVTAKNYWKTLKARAA
ncbi:hypothetical protein D2T29_22170 [Sinirhodobacter populi]|uniref:LamG domain-containing protein n=1 Tax=Paenirhodobacter populi TaxID=2306993 RepID=A0A443JXU1_9RHOB|nr:hypothetical protein [Sinirhodobacter populi]RWR25294.1 hypothetical protein D2T29_22170 [Sinirhodobacter populi]